MSIKRYINNWFVQRLGGWASTHVVAVLAAILALDSADRGAIGAMAPELVRSFGISQTELGLMVTVTTFAGAVGTLFFGWLVDRVCRTRLLALATLLWSAVMILCAGAPSYMFLLVSRAGLGIVVAAALPSIASLTGDYFQAHLRARMYGYILVGQFVGTGLGIGITGELALFTWRLGFGFLALMGIGVAWLVCRLPEPERGSAGYIRPGRHRTGGSSIDTDTEERGGNGDGGNQRDRQLIRELIRQKNVLPHKSMIRDEDPGRQSLFWAIKYVLHIRTNIILIISSAVGYYFFAGARTFGVEFIQGRFHLFPTAAIGIVGLFGLAALAGVLAAGQFADYLLARGFLNGRVIVAISAYFAAAVFLSTAILTPSLAVAVPILVFAGLSFGAINPPLDAARLDIMHPYLWGRAESVRMVLRLLAEGIAPVLFGFIADQVFGGGNVGLQRAFLLMVIPLFLGGVIGIMAFRTYPRDVATADLYARRTKERESGL